MELDITEAKSNGWGGDSTIGGTWTSCLSHIPHQKLSLSSRHLCFVEGSLVFIHQEACPNSRLCPHWLLIAGWIGTSATIRTFRATHQRRRVGGPWYDTTMLFIPLLTLIDPLHSERYWRVCPVYMARPSWTSTSTVVGEVNVDDHGRRGMYAGFSKD